jgi:hypothetical protein
MSVTGRKNGRDMVAQSIIAVFWLALRTIGHTNGLVATMTALFMPARHGLLRSADEWKASRG